MALQTSACKRRTSNLLKAVETELSNPDRIRRYANNLSGPAEEAGFALKELRRSGKSVPPVLAVMLTEKSAEDVRASILSTIPLLSADTVAGFMAFLPAADALTGRGCKTVSDQDAADLANAEPRRFNRFASPAVHNGVRTLFMTCQVKPP